MMWWNGMDGWGWGMAIVHSVLWWVILGVGIVLLVRLLRREPPSGEPTGETALRARRNRQGGVRADEARHRGVSMRVSRKTELRARIMCTRAARDAGEERG